MLSKRQKLVVPLLLMSMQSISSFMEPLANINIGSTIPTDLSKGCTIIGTHDGSFHCDEALAVSLLKLYYNFQSNSDVYIVRTRKPDILSACNVVVDVGAVYEPENHRYDHHQREFKGVMKGFNTKLSSAGLIYKHFGLDIIRYILMKTLDNNEISNEVLDLVYNKVYKDFMEHIDAIDNGISVATGEPNYHMSTGLSARVGYLNPEWNEPQSPEIMNDCFQNAMKLTCSEFLSYTVSTAKSWWPARDIVEKAVNQRFDVHESGKILLFPQPLPWKEHLFEIERMNDMDTQVLYVLYPDSGGSWRIQAVPATPTSFESRKKLPSDWCGVRDEELSKLSGIEDCIFIHASGFIGGNKSKEGALKMAIKALE